MALLETQVTTRSPMGAIIYHTGGLLIDDGWIRILGSGNPRLQRDLPGWNQGKAAKITNQQPGFLLVADDAIGGFFLLNGGSLGNDHGHIYYFSPADDYALDFYRATGANELPMVHFNYLLNQK